MFHLLILKISQDIRSWVSQWLFVKLKNLFTKKKLQSVVVAQAKQPTDPYKKNVLYYIILCSTNKSEKSVSKTDNKKAIHW